MQFSNFLKENKAVLVLPKSIVTQIYLSFFLLLSLSYNPAFADDDYVIEAHFCFGNTKRVLIEGRVIESRSRGKPVSISDNILENTWEKLKQFFNDEAEKYPVYLVLPNGLYNTKTDDEGYFQFEIDLPKPLEPKYYRAKLNLKNFVSEKECQLLILPDDKGIGIISDFDDTVIVTDVINKAQAVKNTLFKNYKQRQVVQGMSHSYKGILSKNDYPSLSTLFFVTGSPRQLSTSIHNFLNYHHFPDRVLIGKKLNGENSDPFLDQLSYKTKRISMIFELYPKMQFILVGDDGEKDPEIYNIVQKTFPDQVLSIWIRKVSTNPNKKTYPNVHYFQKNPKL